MRGPISIAVVACVSCGADPAAGGGSDSGSSDSSGAASSTSSGVIEPGDDTTSGAATSSGSSGLVETDGSTGEAFVLDVHTVLTDDGRLAFTANLPPAVGDCLEIPGAPCDDIDADDLVDVWEDEVLDRLRPLRRFDELEQLLDDAGAVVADVGRVVAVDADFRVFVMLGYSRDYGSCGFTAHNGDSERVALSLSAYPEGGPGGVVVAQAYTAAHEGTVNDHGQVFAGSDLDQLVFAADPVTAEPRWVVFPSRDKHATYATIDICEGISVVPCVEEDCAPDGVGDPAAFDVLPVSANAGEETAPRLRDLGPVGFPGEDAWADQEFCGGLGGTGCSSSVRSKLLVDPF